MFEQQMAFQVGDQVIHSVYGLGVIVRYEQKELFGDTKPYYVVQIRDMALWVPISESGEKSLRYVTPADDFVALFQLLSSPPEMLPSDRFFRKTRLMELLKEGRLDSICRVVRDLTHQKQTAKLNESDNAILERARNSLLTEWCASLSVPLHQAEEELNGLLAADVV